MAPPSLRTQSQPFQINSNAWAAVNNTAASMEDSIQQCSCDSILSRLIYGYNNHRRTMESLHPNIPAMQQMQQMGPSFGASQPVLG